ncbi:MAG: winged helix DNA-binding domain-containing protein [Labedaea sp.]
MPAKILTERVLNRSLLERQLLLGRVDRTAVEAVEHLVGMQAQAPNAPYIGLWARLAGFTTDELAGALTDRRLVRASLMRGTIHLVSAGDCRAIGPHLATIFERAVRNTPGVPTAGELEAVLATATRLLEEEPRTLAELRELLGSDGNAAAARYLLPLVHVPPRGIWGVGGRARLTTVRAWLGPDAGQRSRLAAVLRRYLAAFGPASVKDMQTWCGLTGLREVVDELGPQLCAYRDEHGVELFDLPDAPFPDPETPAPVRLLPEYDNCLRSHTDRGRVMSAANRAALFATKNDAPMPAFLVDGFVRGTWKLTRVRDRATVLVRPFAELSGKETAAVRREAEALLDFAAAAAATREVRFGPS